jgi:hypothetical protein
MSEIAYGISNVNTRIRKFASIKIRAKRKRLSNALRMIYGFHKFNLWTIGFVIIVIFRYN